MDKQQRNLERARKIITYVFLLVPVISATISAFHVEKFLRLGNPTFLSVSTAIAYEIANVGAMLIFVLMPKVKQNFIWISFIILIFMQIVGNVYFAFDYIYNNIDSNPYYVDNFIKMVRVMTDFLENDTIIFILSCLVGAPVPIVALLLTKSTSDYFKDEEDKPKEVEPKAEVQEETEEIEEEEKPIEEKPIEEKPFRSVTEIQPPTNKDEEDSGEGSGVVVKT